jgi:hypothetical protein
MLGVLVKGGLDDGRGKARVNLFRHKHEVESGRTSSVGMEIMGYDVHGEVVTSSVPGRKLTWEEIGKRSVISTKNVEVILELTETRPKSSASLTWQAMSDIFEPLSSDCSVVVLTTVF